MNAKDRTKVSAAIEGSNARVAKCMAATLAAVKHAPLAEIAGKIAEEQNELRAHVRALKKLMAYLEKQPPDEKATAA